MRKVILTSALIGLIAVPGVVIARHGNGSDDSSTSQTQQTAEAETEHADSVDDNSGTADQRLSSHDDQNTQDSSIESDDDEDGSVEQEDALPTGSISIDEARAIAEEAHPGSSVNKIEVETEHGAVVFSVRFDDGAKVDVDSNGSIVKVEVEEEENEDESSHSDDDNDEVDNDSDDSSS